MNKILLFSHLREQCENIRHALARLGIIIQTTNNLNEANQWVKENEYDMLLVCIDDEVGMMLLKTVTRTSNHHVCISIFTEENTVNGFRAHHKGAIYCHKYKEGEEEELAEVIRMRIEIHIHLPRLYVHKNPEFLKCLTQIRAYFRHGQPMLLTGEQGTGKTFIAEHVYVRKRKHPREIEVDCETLSMGDAEEKLFGVARNYRSDIKRERKGIMQQANDKGVLILTDIDRLPIKVQDELAEALDRHSFCLVGTERVVQWKIQSGLTPCASLD